MADLIGALSKKRAALCGRKQKILADYDHAIQEINAEIANVDAALAAINDTLKDYICPNCSGTGEVRYTDAAGSRDYKECPRCRGTGIKMEGK